MTIYEDLEDFTDPDGLVQNRKFPHRGASGNGILYTSEAMCILALQGLLRQEHRVAFMAALTRCAVPDQRGGLYRRAPGNDDQEGPDDYVGLCTASALLELPLAKWILEYGQAQRVRLWGPIRVRYVYNNVVPGTLRRLNGTFNGSAWLGRSPSFRAHLHYCAGQMPPIWLRLAWCWAVATAGYSDPKAQDPWRLSWLLVLGMQNQSWICRVAAKIRAWRLRRAWPGGLPEVEAAYFGFADHFIPKWMPPR